MTRTIVVRGLALIVAAAIGALLVAASGIVPIGATTGHFAVTRWFLEFGKRRSVATHTLGLDLPPLDDAWLVLKGAGHYDGGCRPCHGSPAQPNPDIPASMTPPPPYLVPRLEVWDPAELFYIVKHGIKFTGMPAWPTQQRDDEIHAVVAFLLELPSLDADAYRTLVHGNAEDAGTGVPPLGDLDGAGAGVARTLVEDCSRCHGRTGQGAPAFPKLAGQKPEYLRLALEAYADAERNSGIMGPIAAALEPRERRAFAEYYARLPSAVIGFETGAESGAEDSAESAAADGAESAAADGAQVDAAAGAAVDAAAAVARGRTIAERGIPSAGVPSCVDCHGPGPERRNAAYPLLAAQYREYLVLQLTLFNEGRRGGSPYAHLMQHVATKLTREQMLDVASYYASLPPERSGGLPE